MGRRDQDARPPIEVIGTEPGLTSTQSVTLGPRRPKPGRGRSLVVALAVVAVLVGGLLLGDDPGDAEGAGEEERDNQERIELDKPQTSTTRPTTTSRPTTTTSTVPVGPPFGTPIEGMLLTYTGNGWSAFDLTTGAKTEVDLPEDGAYEGISVPGGVVLATSSHVATYHRLLAADDGEPATRELGPATQVFASGDDGLVWLVAGPGDDLGVASVLDVRLVDLEGNVHRSFTVEGRWASGATTDAVIVARAGRVYAADERGLRAIATGWATGAMGDDVVVVSCDEGGVCGLWLQPVDGGSPRLLEEVESPETTYYDWAVSEGQRLAMVSRDDRSGSSNGRLLLFDGSGASLGTYTDDGVGGFVSRPEWLPGDLGLVVPSGSRVVWLRPVASGSEPTATPLPLERAGTERVFVVTP